MLQWAAVHGFMELIVKNWQSVTVATLFRSTTKGSATVGQTGLETGATVPKKITRLVLEMEKYAGMDNVHVKTVTPALKQVVEVITVPLFLQRITATNLLFLHYFKKRQMNDDNQIGIPF